MLPDSHAKSFLSRSYVNAVVTQAGFGCQFSEPDYGIDALVSEVQVLPSGRYVNSGYHFNVQIKASHARTRNDESIVYALDTDAHNRLVYHTGGLIVLVLFFLPQDAEERISLTEQCLELRNCCYWYIVRGESIEGSQSKRRIHIPRRQVFDPNACKALMESVRSNGWRQ